MGVVGESSNPLAFVLKNPNWPFWSGGSQGTYRTKAKPRQALLLFRTISAKGNANA